MTPEAVAERLDVSRETLSRFGTFLAVLSQWQAKMNLVAGIEDVWERHILDCGRIFPLLGGKSPVLDIGSGAGFPGLVLAIMAAEKVPDMRFILVESNTRKCAFLNAAAREVGISVEVVNGRVEDIPAMKPAARPAVITARAVAPLQKLLSLTSRHHHPGLECLFFKGAQYRKELTALENYPNINHEILNSGDYGDGVIIRLSGFTN